MNLWFILQVGTTGAHTLGLLAAIGECEEALRVCRFRVGRS